MLNSKEEPERGTEKEQIKSWEFTDRVVSKTPTFTERCNPAGLGLKSSPLYLHCSVSL